MLDFDRQHTATQTLSLLCLDAADRRIITCRATDPGAAVAECDREERRRASAVALLPDLAQGGYLRLSLAVVASAWSIRARAAASR